MRIERVGQNGEVKGDFEKISEDVKVGGGK